MDTVIEEIENALEDADGEVERLLEIEKQSLAGATLSLECSQCQEEGEAGPRRLTDPQNRMSRSGGILISEGSSLCRCDSGLPGV